MNRRGFMKIVAVTPLVGLLKPEPVERIILQGGQPPRQSVKWRKFTQLEYDRSDDPLNQYYPTIRVVGEDQPPARIMFGYTPPRETI